MRRLTVGLALALAISLAMFPASLTVAGKIDTVTDEDTGDLNLNAVTGVVYTDGGSGGPRCSWSRYTVGRLEDGLGNPPEPPRGYNTPDEELTPEELQTQNAERQRRASTAVPNLGGVTRRA